MSRKEVNKKCVKEQRSTVKCNMKTQVTEGASDFELSANGGPGIR